MAIKERVLARRSVPKTHMAKKIVVGIVGVFVAMHMAATVVYNIPSTSFQQEQRPQTFSYSYMRPFFHQDYRIFAPDPASENRKLEVRAWIFDEASGEHFETEWASITDMELSSKYRYWARKQHSVYAAEQLAPAFRALSTEQKEIARTNFHRSTLDDLRQQLIAAAPDQKSSVVARFMQQTRYSLAYGTAVARTLWDDLGRIDGIQVRSVYYPVIRWDDRNDPNAEAPPPRYYAPAWRAPLDVPGFNSEKFSEVIRKWSEQSN